MATFKLGRNPVAFRKVVVWSASTDAALSTSPTITSGSAAPSANEPVGSLYLRTGGSSFETIVYVKTASGAGAGNWKLSSSVTTATAGLTVSGGAFAFTGTNFDLDPTGNFTLDMDSGGSARILLDSNSDNAFVIESGADDMLVIHTDTDGMLFGNATTNPTFGFLGSGAFTVAGNLNAGAGIDITADSQPLTVGASADLSISHDGTDSVIDSVLATAKLKIRTGTDTSATSIVIENDSGQDLYTVTGDADHAFYAKDNSATAWSVNQAGNAYIKLDTSNSSEKISLNNATTNGQFEVLGSGQITLTGNVNANAGLDVSGDSLTLEHGREISYRRLTKVVINAVGGSGGATAGTFDLDVQTLDGSNVNLAKQVLVRTSLTAPNPLAPVSTVTFATATAGSIVSTGNGYALVLTDATGNFTCAVNDSADETVYLWAESAPGCALSGQGCLVVESIADTAIWSA